MGKKAIVAVLVCLIFCGGCTSLEKVMDSWVGQPSDELVALWGSPHLRMPLNNGGQVLTWENTEGNYQWGFRNCRKTFTTNSVGIIEKWSYSNCGELFWK